MAVCKKTTHFSKYFLKKINNLNNIYFLFLFIFILFFWVGCLSAHPAWTWAVSPACLRLGCQPRGSWVVSPEDPGPSAQRILGRRPTIKEVWAVSPEIWIWAIGPEYMGLGWAEYNNSAQTTCRSGWTTRRGVNEFTPHACRRGRRWTVMRDFSSVTKRVPVYTVG